MGAAIRDAVADDVAAISGLYNALIASTTVAWNETMEPLEERRAWLVRQQSASNPVLVAEVGGAVVGFASYDDFRDSEKWPGYRFTVEHTIHVARDHWGAGIGRDLVEALIARAVVHGKHVMVGALDADNVDSLRFHERLGFHEVGRLPELGFKFGRWLDLVLVQRRLGDGDGGGAG
jgi:L-amino acid N-acyltransferase YncA